MNKIIIYLLIIVFSFFLLTNIIGADFDKQIFYVIFLFFFILVIKQKYNYFLFLVILLYNFNFQSVFSTDAELFGIIDIVELIAIIVLILIYYKYPKVIHDKLNKKYIQAISLYLLLYYLFSFYVIWKNEFIIYSSQDVYPLFRRGIRYLLYFSMFFVLIRRATIRKIYHILDISIISFAIFYSISTFFSSLFVDLSILKHNYDIWQLGRTTGLFVGDENYFGANLGMVFGYIVGRIEKEEVKKIYYFTLAVIILAIANTGSRGALLGIVIILIYFLVRNKNKRKLMSKGLLLILLLIILLGFAGQMILQRLFLKSEDTSQLGMYGAESRFVKLLIYANDLSKNQLYFLTGNTKPAPIFRNTHNAFMNHLYFGGLLFFIMLVFVNLKMFTLKSINPGSYNLWYVLIPYFVMLLDVDYSFYFILPLLVIMSYGYKETDITKMNLNNGNIKF